MDTITQITTQDTAPDPAGGPGGKRLQKHVAPDRRISIEDADMRHGRKSSAKTFNGCNYPGRLRAPMPSAFTAFLGKGFNRSLILEVHFQELKV